jgi:predicted TIM-barrel fold metal-dependent hydrolase
MTVIDSRCSIGLGVRSGLGEDELLRAMDAAGIDWAVIGPADHHIAVSNKAGNDLVAAAVSRHPDRFVGTVTVNPWYLDGALEELDRGIALGLVGLQLHPALQGIQPLDRHVDDLVSRAVAASQPIYIHTGTPIVGHPFQVAELALRHPSGRFVMGHSGHSDFWIDVLPAAISAPNIWLETSYKSPHVISEYVAALGPERVLFGSDAPRNDMALELAKVKGANLDRHHFDAVASGTARDLYRVPRMTA